MGQRHQLLLRQQCRQCRQNRAAIKALDEVHQRIADKANRASNANNPSRHHRLIKIVCTNVGAAFSGPIRAIAGPVAALPAVCADLLFHVGSSYVGDRPQRNLGLLCGRDVSHTHRAPGLSLLSFTYAVGVLGGIESLPMGVSGNQLFGQDGECCRCHSWNLSVSSGCKSLHLAGHPISHSVRFGFG